MTTPTVLTEPPVESMRTSRLSLIRAGLMLGMFHQLARPDDRRDGLPTIVSDLGDVDGLAWVVTAYLLASTASTLMWESSAISTGASPSSRSRSSFS